MEKYPFKGTQISKTNCRSDGKTIWVRVICPNCGISGSMTIGLPQCTCHICTPNIKMLPASNTEITGTWDELIEYCKWLRVRWGMSPIKSYYVDI